MRLLIISQYFWPENFRINDLVTELVRRGHEVTVLTGKPNYPDGDVFPEFLEHPENFLTYKGASIIRVPIWARGSSRLSLFLNYLSYAVSAALFGLFHLRDQQFDAIFVFEPSPVTVGLPAIILRRLKHSPVAFWVLDQWPETLAAIGVVKSKVVLKLVGLLVAFIYARCDLVLAQSKSLVSMIGKYCNDPERICYFPSWDDSGDVENYVIPAAEVPVMDGSFNILFAGNIGEAQDFSAILDAAELLIDHKNIRWLIVGDGRMASWVKGEAARRGLQENFVLLGRYPVDRMPSFYQHADGLLVSLKSDPVFSMTLPGKIQSYLAAGIPILGMLDGEGASVIQDSRAGFACPAGDSRALAEAVLCLSRLTDVERQSMGQRGAAYSRREFDRGILISRLETWLMNLSYKCVKKKGSAT